jgi:hypothetical protein
VFDYYAERVLHARSYNPSLHFSLCTTRLGLNENRSPRGDHILGLYHARYDLVVYVVGRWIVDGGLTMASYRIASARGEHAGVVIV